MLAFLAAWVIFQVTVPLRHFVYQGRPSWTEEGHRFSWQMKLRDKRGTVSFSVTDPVTGITSPIDIRQYLDRRQQRKMSTRPDMILQFAHYLADEWRQDLGHEVEVRADVWVSLNGRRPAPLIDPETDLAAVPRDLRHADWILPLTEPLRAVP